MKIKSTSDMRELLDPRNWRAENYTDDKNPIVWNELGSPTDFIESALFQLRSIIQGVGEDGLCPKCGRDYYLSEVYSGWEWHCECEE